MQSVAPPLLVSDDNSVRSVIIRYKNCLVLRGGALERDDLWVRNGVIIDPMQLFFKEAIAADLTVECNGLIASPGFVDLQVNG